MATRVASTQATLHDTIGDTIVIEVDFGTDVSGLSFLMQWRTRPKSSVIAATPTIDDSDAADGIVRFSIDTVKSNELGVGRWHFDVERWDPADRVNTTETWPKGTITLQQDVTREVAP